MKTILCYGDSNTYGYDPSNGFRYPKNVRWTGVLAELLGPEFTVIEEGCNGRTTVFDDPLEGWKNGLDYLKPCLNSHKPIDLVILMLGSNDLKDIFHASAAQIADGAGVLVKTIQEFTQLKQGYVPQIVLVSPPVIGPGIENSPFSYAFDESAIARSHQFAEEYRRVADKLGCQFFDAAPVAPASRLDSLHLMPEAHKSLGEALAETVKKTII
ncbi:MAG: SGNH/GDSL hydrolase family protein [Firmicutes bacterium]|nr:SGNH/GDSL hydrolase family protein [Bacillota bacterium]